MAGQAPDGHRKLRRGDLTREAIVRESLRLLDAGGVAGFSLPKLGRALGADPTAVYRHFTSKDDLVLAVADLLIEESAKDMVRTDCWVETLRESCRRLRKTYLAHPAAASLSSYRVTQGPAEMRVVDTIVDCVLRAGFEGADAALMYRTIGDFSVYWSGAEASVLAMDDLQQKKDENAWTSAYLTAQREQYPAIWQIRDHLPSVPDDAIFESILSIVISGVEARAPRPCTCEKHARPDESRPMNPAR
jgi:AcrR family transcriptional regulator